MASYIMQRPGSRGPDTELLQLGLNRAGFYPFQPDGIFGSNTQKAVTDFQKSVGLAVDGIAGVRTWAALYPWLAGYILHTVRRGDSLYKIAMAHGTTLRAVQAANPETDPQNLPVGSQVTVPLGFELVPGNISFTSTVMELCTEGLRARYPFISEQSIGRSVLGRELRVLKIGRGPRQVFYNASHHANEWITTPL
ncbi:MAG: peptidoglycan-binding protein, partial [Oscillospiraceae bacterium]|nr:peptidoglycan-binding protein [Oscillospiraceae bacterium]